MLKQILVEFQQAHGAICLDELSRKMAVESSALEGMLHTLVQAGRLLEIDPTDQGCVACPAKGGCIILTNGLQKSYIMRPKVS